MLYYPCIENRVTGRINVVVSKKPMTKDEASRYLKEHYPHQWWKAEAIPQPVSMFEIVKEEKTNADSMV